MEKKMLDEKCGRAVAEAIRICVNSAVAMAIKKSPNDRTKFGRITAINGKRYTLLIEKTVYPNVMALKSSIDYQVGDSVICQVPNGNMSNIYIVGVLDT